MAELQPWILVAVTVVFAAAVFFLSRRPRPAETVDEAMKAAMDEQSKALAETMRGFEDAVTEAKSWQTKFERAFATVEQMERERNVWKGMYYDAGLGHAAAQEMLFREIERLSVKAKEPVREHLKDLVDGYRATHVLSEAEAEAKVQAASAVQPKLG